MGSENTANLSIKSLFCSTDEGTSDPINANRVFQIGGAVPKNVETVSMPLKWQDSASIKFNRATFLGPILSPKSTTLESDAVGKYTGFPF